MLLGVVTDASPKVLRLPTRPCVLTTRIGTRAPSGKAQRESYDTLSALISPSLIHGASVAIEGKSQLACLIVSLLAHPSALNSQVPNDNQSSQSKILYPTLPWSATSQLEILS